MEKTIDILAIMKLLIQLLKILFFGPNNAMQLEWARQVVHDCLRALVRFPIAFPYEKRREIENNLRDANLCEKFDPIRAKWQPEQDWETIIKMLIEFCLVIIHQWSPKPEPPGPPVPPDEAHLEEYVRDWILANVDEPGRQQRCVALTKAMLASLNEFRNDPPATLERARSLLRQVVTKNVTDNHHAWLSFSAMIDQTLTDITEVEPDLSMPELIILWQKIANGIAQASL